MGLANVGRGAVQEAPWGGGSGADEKEEGDSFWGTHGGLWIVCSDGNEHRAMAVARCSVFFWSSVLLKGLGVLHVMHTRVHYVHLLVRVLYELVVSKEMSKCPFDDL